MTTVPTDARIKELCGLMRERFSMNPVSCNILNEEWKASFPSDPDIAKVMLSLLSRAATAEAALAVREAQSGWTNNGQADAALVMLDRIDTLDTDDDERIEEVKRIVRLLAAPPAPAVPAELLDAMAEVIRISDRDHEAWDRAKAAISACRTAKPVAPIEMTGSLAMTKYGIKRSNYTQWVKGWNACRAAMLNHSGDSAEKAEPVSQGYTLNSPAIPDGCSTMPTDYFSTLVNAARLAADKSMRKHPQPNYVLLKVAEEAGEVVQAGVHYAEGRMTWKDLEGEIVQLLAMLIRLVTEGDQVNGINPPASCSTATLAVAPDEIEIFVDQVCGNLPAGHQQ